MNRGIRLCTSLHFVHQMNKHELHKQTWLAEWLIYKIPWLFVGWISFDISSLFVIYRHFSNPVFRRTTTAMEMLLSLLLYPVTQGHSPNQAPISFKSNYNTLSCHPDALLLSFHFLQWRRVILLQHSFDHTILLFRKLQSLAFSYHDKTKFLPWNLKSTICFCFPRQYYFPLFLNKLPLPHWDRCSYCF